jgi:hypothetical protein
VTVRSAPAAVGTVLLLAFVGCGPAAPSAREAPPRNEPILDTADALAGVEQRDIVLGSEDAEDVMVVYADPDALRVGDFAGEVLGELLRGPVGEGRLQLQLAAVTDPVAPVELDAARDPAKDVLAAARQGLAWQFALRYAAVGTGAYRDDLALRVARGVRGLDVARWLRDASSRAVARRRATYRERHAVRGGDFPMLRLDGGRDGRDVQTILPAEMTARELARTVRTALSQR